MSHQIDIGISIETRKEAEKIKTKITKEPHSDDESIKKGEYMYDLINYIAEMPVEKRDSDKLEQTKYN